jgi:hypothetical protein
MHICRDALPQAQAYSSSCRKEQSVLDSPYLPLHVRDTDFLAGLLVVVEPLPVGQVDGIELGGCLETFGCELALVNKSAMLSLLSNLQVSYFSFEFYELKSSTIKLENVLCLRWLGAWVCSRCCLHVCRVLPLLLPVSLCRAIW